MLKEKRSIFGRNDAVIKAVLSTAQGSVVKAVLSIALNTARAPALNAAYFARRVHATCLRAALTPLRSYPRRLLLLIVAVLTALLAMLAAALHR
jgi:hypothetical protein